MCLGVCKPALFRPGHWVSADEVFFHVQRDDLFVDGGLNAPGICKNTVTADQLFKPGEIGSVAGDRSAQENIAASPEVIVNGSASRIYDSLLDGEGKRFPAFIKCDQFVVRPSPINPAFAVVIYMSSFLFF